jgi:hypothetical protein
VAPRHRGLRGSSVASTQVGVFGSWRAKLIAFGELEIATWRATAGGQV